MVEMYLPLLNVPPKNYLIRISIKKLCFLTVSLPFFAFIICIIMTMYKDFDNANNTHCKVPNIFPSISASIGNYEPQRTIWKIAIFSHAPFRILMIYLRWDYYTKVISRIFHVLVKLAVFLNFIENIALIGITYWTSNLNYSHHELCFKMFIGASIIYMLLCCIMLSKYRRKSHQTTLEKYSIKIKWRTFIINAGSFAFAAYFFLRHNRLCEPYVYSMFGFSEYIVVTTNIMFHLTTVYDLHDKYILISKAGLSLE